MPLHLDSSSIIECGPHRTISRTVSWNTSGIYLAYGSSDRVTRLVTIEPTQAREVVVLTGHQGPVTHVRFHPSDKTLLCTTSTDLTVRLWDCRGGAQREAGTVELGGGGAIGIDWCGSSSSSGSNGNMSGASMSHALAVTERDSRVVVYDTRKLGSSSGASSRAGSGSSTSSSKANSNPAVLHVSEPRHKERIEAAIFGPGNGKHLIAASQLYDSDTTSDLLVWDWTKGEKRDSGNELRFSAHTEGIYTMALSPDGKRLATGGADAIVGLWDIDSMTMVNTVSRRIKFIRSVAFSHDGKVLAHSSEENDVELVNANNGDLIGQVSLGSRRGGADHIAWHPTYPILACARVDSPMTTNSPVAIAKLSLSSSSQWLITQNMKSN